VKRRMRKRRIAALALALLAFPATALAAPQDLRHEAPSSSLGIPPELASRPAVPSHLVGRHLPAVGTDVAAPDQQSSPRGVSVPTESASASSGFDWADAGIGAAGAASLFGIALAGALSLRRRTSSLAG
jgi:hypothetical protein